MRKAFITALMCIPFILSAQIEYNTQTDALIHQIDALIKTTVLENDIPALSVGLVYKGEPLLSKGYGTIIRGSKIKTDEETIYQIASLSKMFTGIIANNLAIEGQLILENSIVNYLPKDLSKKVQKKLGPIQVIDVLLHRSGLPRDSKVMKRKDGEPMLIGYTEQDLLKDLKKLKLKSKPGQSYRYSNVGYMLIGYILEKASGLTYKELLDKYIVEKYKLNGTTVAVNRSQIVATPYRKDSRKAETKAWETGMFVSASGIYSNGADLSKILICQLNAYAQFQSKTISNPLVLTEKKGSRGKEGSYYGMGLFEDHVQRGVTYGHRGDMDGFASEYSFNTTTKTGVVLLTSSGGEWVGLLSAEINKILEERTISSNDKSDK